MYILFSDKKLIIERRPDGSVSLPTPHPSLLTADSSLPTLLSSLPDEEERFCFGRDGVEYIAADIAGAEYLPAGLETAGLRESFLLLPQEQYAAAAKGAELLHWNRMTRCCARCGAPLRRHTDISRICPQCGQEYFPSPAPCVIVLVTRGEGADEEVLLVHARTFTRPFFGLVAGFVETGESLEECVAREVREETSLEIEDIRYFGSQAWPYPFQLMLGFTARWRSGEVRFADGELTDGGFYRRDALPPIPTPPSIAHRLITTWLHAEP